MTIEEAIGKQLENWGFSVIKIPESHIQGDNRPDYEVVCDQEHYLIEVKSREDDGNEINEKEETLNKGEIYDQHRALTRKNTDSGIIRNACDQLRKYGNEEHVRLIWLCVVDDAQEAKFEQFKSTLYGKSQVFDLDRDSQHRPCYFYGRSDFYRRKDILDGVIVSTPREAELCLNPFSVKYTKLQRSQFAVIFKNSICDPIKEESEGLAYVVDSNVDRRDEEAVMAYLSKKYQAPKLQKVDLGWHSASMLI